MKELHFEVIITQDGNQKKFILNKEPVLIGTAHNCEVKVNNNDDPKIKALLQKEEDYLLVKIFDINFPITLSGKKYKNAKLKKSVHFKVAEIEILLTIEEVSLIPNLPDDSALEVDFPDYDDSLDTQSSIVRMEEEHKRESEKLKRVTELPDSFDEPGPPAMDIPEVKSAPSLPTEPSLPDEPKLPGTDIIRMVNDTPTKKEIKQKEEELIPYDEFFDFDTTFKEEELSRNSFYTYKNPLLDFSDYIDMEDETIKKLPTQGIHKQVNGHSIHVIHSNNGTALSEEYYPLNMNRIFLSNKTSKKNYFQAHDAPSAKEEFIYSRGEGVYVVTPHGYTASRFRDHKFAELTENANELFEGDKIILAKGTSQIVIETTPTPSKIKPNKFFNIEEQLLKNLAMSWALSLLFIATVVIFDANKQEDPKKEVVVILKRKKVEKLDKTPTPPSAETAKAEVERKEPQVEQKQPAPKKPEKEKVAKKVEKPITKPKPVKVSQPRPTPRPVQKVAKTKPRAASKPTKTRTVTKAPAPPPAPKKKFKFNFGSKMNSMVAKANNTELKTAKAAGSVSNIANSVSSASSTSTNFNTSKIGKTNTKVGRFAAGLKTGKSQAIGTKGLSGKTKSTTAYIEANTKILGAMDPDLIRKLMREFIPQFRHCYQRELVTNPSVAGVFDLEFQINARGKGVSVGVKKKGKNFSSSGIGCLKRVVSQIKFPRPKGGGLVDVKQPMNFYQQ